MIKKAPERNALCLKKCPYKKKGLDEKIEIVTMEIWSMKSHAEKTDIS